MNSAIYNEHINLLHLMEQSITLVHMDYVLKFHGAERGFAHAEEPVQRPHNNDNHLDHSNHHGHGALLDRLEFHQPLDEAALSFPMHEAGLPVYAGLTQARRSRQDEQANWPDRWSLPASSSSSRLQSQHPGEPNTTEIHRFPRFAGLAHWHEARPQMQLMNASPLPVPIASGLPRLGLSEEIQPWVQSLQPLEEEPLAEERLPFAKGPGTEKLQPLAEEIQLLPFNALEEAAGMPEDMQIDRNVATPEPPPTPGAGSSNDSRLASSAATTETWSMQSKGRHKNNSADSEEDTSFTLGGHLKSIPVAANSREGRDENQEQRKGSDGDVNPKEVKEGKKISQQEQLRGIPEKKPSQLRRESKDSKAQKPKTRSTGEVKNLAKLEGNAKRQAMLEAADDLKKNKRQRKPMR